MINVIPLGCSLPLTVTTVNSVQTLKGTGAELGTRDASTIAAHIDTFEYLETNSLGLLPQTETNFDVAMKLARKDLFQPRAAPFSGYREMNTHIIVLTDGKTSESGHQAIANEYKDNAEFYDSEFVTRWAVKVGETGEKAALQTLVKIASGLDRVVGYGARFSTTGIYARGCHGASRLCSA
jgi:hypothetical protein